MRNKSEILEKVNTAIETIRPYLKSDGGDIIIDEITDDLIVKVKLIGACGSCPFSLHTLKAGVEMTIRKEIPEIKEVVAI
jgi:Fe-S cluster biogenesis protein NfuA